MSKQGKRTRALDSRGRPLPGLYVRDGRFIAGFQQNGSWRMQTLQAETLTGAKRERESVLSGLREGRIAAKDNTSFEAMFSQWQEARNLSERTREYEQYVLDHHLPTMKGRKVQDIASSDVAKVLRDMRDTYSGWTCSAVYKVLKGTFGLALRRGVITRNPMDGLAPSERPKQQNAKKIAVLTADDMGRLVASATTERWKAAIGLAGFAGLRLGEIRGLRWGDIDLEGNTISISRSLLPDGTAKSPKTAAGIRTVPLLPMLRRLLVEWKLRSPWTGAEDYVICTAEGAPVQQRNLRRVLDQAKEAAGFDGTEDRLSWHSLRHSFASMLATDLELPATTLARIVGHADAGFSLRVYAKDARDESAVVTDVLNRAATARIGR
jgi:integrase